MPTCTAVRSDLAKYLPRATPNDQPRSNTGTQAIVDCGLQGPFVFDGHPIGRLYVVYGRIGPGAAAGPGQTAKTRAADGLRMSCSQPPSPVTELGGLDYAQTCVGDDPVLHQVTGLANNGDFVVVSLFIDDQRQATSPTLRRQMAAATRDLAVRSLRRLTS